jgi:hypothetical protein
MIVQQSAQPDPQGPRYFNERGKVGDMTLVLDFRD